MSLYKISRCHFFFLPSIVVERTGDSFEFVYRCFWRFGDVFVHVVALECAGVHHHRTHYCHLQSNALLGFIGLRPPPFSLQVYARWSRQINREIWAAYGDANAKATQALKNIRTVRAFSQELSEVDGFMESTGEALAKGIKDAFMGALTAAMTSVR